MRERSNVRETDFIRLFFNIDCSRETFFEFICFDICAKI